MVGNVKKVMVKWGGASNADKKRVLFEISTIIQDYGPCAWLNRETLVLSCCSDLMNLIERFLLYALLVEASSRSKPLRIHSCTTGNVGNDSNDTPNNSDPPKRLAPHFMFQVRKHPTLRFVIPVVISANLATQHPAF